MRQKNAATWNDVLRQHDEEQAEIDPDYEQVEFCVTDRWTPFYRSLGARYRYHPAGDMVEVRTPDGRCKATQRGGSTATNAASSLLGELARERAIPASPPSSIVPPPPAQLGPQPFCPPCQEPNKTQHEPTNGRSICYGSGHLVPAFYGIERTSSWLLPLRLGRAFQRPFGLFAT
jgi:hypothetical protein